MITCLANNKLNEKWEITDAHQVRHIETDKCLDNAGLHAQDHVYVRQCDSISLTQKWTIEH